MPMMVSAQHLMRLREVPSDGWPWTLQSQRNYGAWDVTPLFLFKPGRCPVQGQTRRLTLDRSLPVYLDKQTFSVSIGMSQRCHERTCAPPQEPYQSIISSTRPPYLYAKARKVNF
jgi:hypothetical protein